MQAFERVAAARSAGSRQRDVVKESGLSRGRVSNLDRIAKKARPQWLTWVEQGLLTLKHLEAVLMLQQPKAEDLLRSAMAGKWSCHKLRTEVKAVRGGRRDDDPHADADVARLEEQLTLLLATRVQIRTKPNAGGELVIAFTDNDTLEGLLERLGYRFE